MCNLLRRSYVNSEPNIAHWSSISCRPFVDAKWNCLIPSLRWLYLSTWRHYWTRANSTYSFAHDHKICSSVHQKFLSFYDASFVSTAATLHSNRMFQAALMVRDAASLNAVCNLDVFQCKNRCVDVRAVACSWSSMSWWFICLVIWVVPTSFSQRLQHSSHRFVMCFLTSNWRRIVKESRSRRDWSMTLHCVFVHYFSCVALRRSWALNCLKNSSWCRLIDSREVFQSPTSSVPQDTFMFILSKDSAVNCRAVLLLFFLSFVVLLCHTSLIVMLLYVGDHNLCVAYPSVSRFTTSSQRSESSLSWSSTNSRSPAQLTVVKKSCTMLHVHELCTLKLWVGRTKCVPYKKEITELSPFLSCSWTARSTRPLPIN